MCFWTCFGGESMQSDWLQESTLTLSVKREALVRDWELVAQNLQLMMLCVKSRWQLRITTGSK